MKHKSPVVFLAALAVLALGGGAALFIQRQETTRLEAERDLARFRQDDLAKLQAENQKLQARQVPAAELAALRADHAALLRLRAELEALKKP